MSLNISHIEDLCRSHSGVSEHKTDDFIKEVHIETSVDEFIREKINNNKIIFLTGNPGDGKTHLILKLQKELGNKVKFVTEGGNFVNDLTKLRDSVNQYYKNKTPAIIAINTGILSSLLQESKNNIWYEEVKDQMYNTVTYEDNKKNFKSNIIVIDLNFRNNLSKKTVLDTIKKILNVSKPCEGCPGNCLPLYNIKRLLSDKVQEQLTILLKKVAETGYHATFRDLSAYIAFLIFGNTSCDKQKTGHTRKIGHLYFENAFKKPMKLFNSSFLKQIEKFDPIKRTNIDIDEKIWHDEITPGDWLIKLDGDNSITQLEDKKKREWFKRKKRRIFFEYRDILEKKIDLFEDTKDTLISFIKEPNQSIKKIISLINKSFGDIQTKESLALWLTHHFDTSKDKFVIKSFNIPREHFKILQPNLNPIFRNAFTDWIPDHLLLVYSNNNNDLSLKIDRSVLHSLLNLDQGQTIKYRISETYLRINLFLEKLSEFKGQEDPNNDEFHIINIEKKKQISTIVNITENKYKRPY